MIGSLRTVVFDAPDHRALAAFYTELLGGEQLDDTDEWTVIRTADGWRLGFQPVPGLRRSTWPSDEVPQQLHLDVLVEDVDAAEQQVLAIGAQRLPGEGVNWRVYADPAGHPFCLVWEPR